MMKKMAQQLQKKWQNTFKRLPFSERLRPASPWERFFRHKKIIWGGIIALLLGFVVSIYIFNKQARAKDMRREITFVDTHQALIFWTTEYPAIGYLRYGKTPSSQDQTAYQTSSVPGTLHAVVLNEIPPEGLSASIHHDGESPFLWPKSFEVRFDQDQEGFFVP